MVDLPAFQKEVQEALNNLEAETYIQRSAGDKYEYLTNQEKDIETEIKKTDLDPAAHTTLLKSYLFEKILGDLKVKLDGSKYTYEAGRKLDDTQDGRDRDFYLHLISPFNSNSVTTSNVGMYSVGRPNDLVVCLPEDKRLEDHLKLICKTEKYR